MKKRLSRSLALWVSLSFLPALSSAADYTVGTWKLSVNENNGVVSISHNDKEIVANNAATFKVDGTEYKQTNMTFKTVQDSDIADDFGTGKEFQVVSEQNDIRALVSYRLYENKDYMLTQLTLVSKQSVSSNYMAPIAATGTVKVLPTSNNVDLFVPWDNDEWIRYNANAFGGEVTSYEVKALFNRDSNEGLVLGSIEHNTWKTGIRTKTASSNQITEMVVYCGAADGITRDKYGAPHGSISGKNIKSAIIMVGDFADWRTGMETYGDLCAIVAPKLPWNSGKPFVWNSWGSLQTSVSYKNATACATWINENLPDYLNDSVMYMDLDSYWDNLTSNNLKRFAAECHQRGQKAGIYWTPFVDWANNPDRQVEGASQYKYKDIWLYHNGQALNRTGANACDPTHPGTQARIVQYITNFQKWGYDFVKLDFMDHGALEADSHYDPSITTGIQAYCQGMAFLDSVADGKLYLNLSIAPLFPANFAHGRRIACDAYASLDNTQYTLNSTTFGWWLDHVYSYNDADNICFEGQTETVNKCRLMSGLITGMMCIGDDFGTQTTAQERAKKFLTNPVLQAARQTRAFRPLVAPKGDQCADTYYTYVADTLYVCHFNFSGSRERYQVQYDPLGLDKTKKYVAHELFSDKNYNLTDGWQLTMERISPVLLKIYPKSETGFNQYKAQTMKTTKRLHHNQIIIEQNERAWSVLGTPIY